MVGSRDSAPFFAALGDPHRLRIVRHLSRQGPQSIARLTEGSGISRQAISKHIRILERAGVVRGARRGRERLLELEPPRLRDARQLLTEVAAGWDDALDRLRRLVEDPRSPPPSRVRVSGDAPRRTWGGHPPSPEPKFDKLEVARSRAGRAGEGIAPITHPLGGTIPVSDRWQDPQQSRHPHQWQRPTESKLYCNRRWNRPP
jgi:DNA-binding transcriptional ArsR family regulator